MKKNSNHIHECKKYFANMASINLSLEHMESENYVLTRENYINNII